MSNTLFATDLREHLIEFNLLKKLKINKIPKYNREIKIGILDIGLGKDSLDSENYIEDHGIHIAGIIKTLNKKAQLVSYNYKYFNMKSYLTGLESLIKNNVDIINISAEGLGYSKEEYVLLKEAEKKGILVIVAAGNDGVHLEKESRYPASYGSDKYLLNNLIVVGNYIKDDLIDQDSNYSNKIVHLSTYGNNIFSLCKNGLCSKTGTSQATALTTGLVSLLYQKSDYTINQIKHILKVHSKKDKYSKYGFLDTKSLIHWIQNN